MKINIYFHQTQRFKPPVFDGNLQNSSEFSAQMKRPPSRMENIVNVVQSGGDYERLSQGIFENYLAQKVSDAGMQNTSEVADWFVFSDSLQRIINQQQNYSIYPYLPYTFAMWHSLLATLQRANISFPSKGFEVSAWFIF